MSADLKLTLFSSATDTKPKREITVAELVGMIRNPSIGVTTTLKKMREARSAERKATTVEEEIEHGQVADAIKKTLPAVTIAGTFTKRKNDALKAHSGLMPIDLDHLEDEELADAQDRLRADPHVVFFYVSPSGHGIKGGMLLSTLPANDAEHKVAYGAVREYLAKTYALDLDPATKDVSRLAFLSSDPDCHHSLDASPLDVEQWRELTTDEKEVERLQDILVKGAITSILTPPPPCPVILQTSDGHILGEAGNLCTLESLPKMGKTGLVGAIIGATIAPEGSKGDFLGMEIPERDGYVIHFDCEQSPLDHFRLIENAVARRARLKEQPDCLKTFSLLQAATGDRWPACELAATTLAEKGGIRLVIFDGGADFLETMNDEETSNELVRKMHAFAVQHACLVVNVIHENPGTENGKTRGHFGSQLWRKSQSCIGLSKGEDGITAVWGKFMRSGDWPKREATYFKYDITQGMHVSVDDPSEDRKQEKKAGKTDELMKLASKVFTAPVMTHTGLEKAIMGEIRKSDKTARTRIKTMVEMGVIIRREDKHYELAK